MKLKLKMRDPKTPFEPIFCKLFYIQLLGLLFFFEGLKGSKGLYIYICNLP